MPAQSIDIIPVLPPRRQPSPTLFLFFSLISQSSLLSCMSSPFRDPSQMASYGLQAVDVGHDHLPPSTSVCGANMRHGHQTFTHCFHNNTCGWLSRGYLSPIILHPLPLRDNMASHFTSHSPRPLGTTHPPCPRNTRSKKETKPSQQGTGKERTWKTWASVCMPPGPAPAPLLLLLENLAMLQPSGYQKGTKTAIPGSWPCTHGPATLRAFVSS